MPKSKRTKATSITPKVRQAVEERDNHCCIFCGKLGRGEAHFIKRSQGGLGIEENLLTVCRECHFQMDDGLARKLYLYKAENYLKSHYPDWDKKDLIYKKGCDT